MIKSYIRSSLSTSSSPQVVKVKGKMYIWKVSELSQAVGSEIKE